MANEKYTFNQIGGSTSVKSSAQSYLYSDYQSTKHGDSTPFLETTNEESNAKRDNIERVGVVENKDHIVDDYLRKPANVPKDSSTKGSRLARQHLLNERINVKKVYC